MAGAVIMVVVLMGWLLHRNGEVTHAGSELLKLNR